jgi:ABC-type Fe3+/spermidine/putrescine transport system ATPase subunit
MPRISLEGVTVRYGKTKGIDLLDLTIHDGEYMCLLGPTGAGKTTTLRAIAGLSRPCEGRISFDGKDITEKEPEERRAVMLSQSYSLFPHMTVAENILFSPVIKGWSEGLRRDTLNNMLDLVRLTKRAEAFPHELSGGMQQRNALARALASGSRVLLLDEPLRALDARLRISLRRELRSLCKSLGITTLHVTHDQDEALVMADRVAVIREGRILQVGKPNEVFERPISPFVANFMGQSNFVSGKVLESVPHTVIEDRAGRRIPAIASDIAPGEMAVIAVKIGETTISKEGPGHFQGEIERVLFEGKFLHLDLMVSDLGRISCKLPAWRMGSLNSGDRVWISWLPEKGTVFHYPKGGLDKELEVE